MEQPSENLHFERRQGGGPKSKKGKQASSQNATKHGCRSKKKLLKGESRREYNKLWKRWAEEYLPMTEVDLELLETLVDCAWRLKRADKALLAAEAEWKAGTQEGEAAREAGAQVSLQQRYRTTAENSYYKAMRVLDARMSAEQKATRQRALDVGREMFEFARMQKLNPEIAEQMRERINKRTEYQTPSRAQKLFRGQNWERAHEELPLLRQTVRVECIDEQTVTTFEPSNDSLIQQGQAMLPPPLAVVRRFEFVDGVIPEEYASWAGVPEAEALPDAGTEEADRVEGPIVGVQAMTTDRWLTVIEEEKARGNGHAGPTGEGNHREPPPPELGETCRCAVCEITREVDYFSRAKRLLPEKWAFSIWGTSTRFDLGRDYPTG